MLDFKCICPVCGWNFPKGFMRLNENGERASLPEDGVLVTTCGKCLTDLKIDTNAKAITILSEEDFANMSDEDRQMMEFAKLLARLAGTAQPQGPLQ